MKRDWSGCERRRRLRPSSQTPTPGAAFAGQRFPPADLLTAACPAPDRSVRRPMLPSAAMHPGYGAAAGGDARFQPGEVIILRQAAGNRGRVAWPHRPALGATDRQRIPRNAGEPREAASQGVDLRPGQGGGGFHRPVASGSQRLAAIRLPARGARPPTGGLRRRGARQGRHGAAWRASPRCCGQSPSCCASYRRRRRDCRS